MEDQDESIPFEAFGKISSLAHLFHFFVVAFFCFYFSLRCTCNLLHLVPFFRILFFFFFVNLMIVFSLPWQLQAAAAATATWTTAQEDGDNFQTVDAVFSSLFLELFAKLRWPRGDVGGEEGISGGNAHRMHFGYRFVKLWTLSYFISILNCYACLITWSMRTNWPNWDARQGAGGWIGLGPTGKVRVELRRQWQQ